MPADAQPSRTSLALYTDWTTLWDIAAWLLSENSSLWWLMMGIFAKLFKSFTSIKEYLIARFSLPLAEPSLNAGIFLYFKQPFNKTWYNLRSFRSKYLQEENGPEHSPVP